MWLARRLKYRCTKMSFPLVLPHRSLTDRVVNVPGFRFLQIRVLHGEATVTKDLRHILKRFVRRLFSANPISIYGIAIDTNV